MSRKRGPKSPGSGAGKTTAGRESTDDGGTRAAHKRVRTASRRSLSSARWLERQLNDPYVAAAKAKGYRSRAAFKLIGLDERFQLFKRGTGGVVYAVDLTEMTPIDGAIVKQADLSEEVEIDRFVAELDAPVDIVLSDMASASTGHAATDHLRIMVLCEIAAALAERILRPGGDLVAKVLQGGAERELLAGLKQRYARVKHAKPPASRSDSSESYVVAQGFRGSNSS
jgi:23S rRNA (uridine2552-2'-O)-methyltransferase